MTTLDRRPVHIVGDLRERSSGIPDLLRQHEDVLFSTAHLEYGDYCILDEVAVERKTASDFIASVCSRRIFDQCAKLSRHAFKVLMIVEGNPYRTSNKISDQAVQGALLSISVAWQIPVLFSRSPAQTVDMLVRAGRQALPALNPALPVGRKPGRLKNRRLFFLQGLPSIGPRLALRLMQHFTCLEKVLHASADELMAIEGIGRKKAEHIRDFLSKPY
jgi:Fanconi anemia group M protein